MLYEGVGQKLQLEFYQRKTQTVARALLGKRLVRVYRGHRLSGLITEVEAYLGIKDQACHSFGDRRTKRTEIMYAAGGNAYIYFIYGMYNCFNVVTEKEHKPEAVLIRALEPIEGIEQMQRLRGGKGLHALTTGPGKLTQALQLTRDLNGQSLLSDDIFIEDEPKIKPSQIVERSRVGVDYAGEHAKWLLRFYVKDSKFISKK